AEIQERAWKLADLRIGRNPIELRQVEKAALDAAHANIVSLAQNGLDRELRRHLGVPRNRWTVGLLTALEELMDVAGLFEDPAFDGDRDASRGFQRLMDKLGRAVLR